MLIDNLVPCDSNAKADYAIKFYSTPTHLLTIKNKNPEGFMQSCTLLKQVKLHILHFLMRSMGAAILEKLSLILWNSL